VCVSCVYPCRNGVETKYETRDLSIHTGNAASLQSCRNHSERSRPPARGIPDAASRRLPLAETVEEPRSARHRLRCTRAPLSGPSNSRWIRCGSRLCQLAMKRTESTRVLAGDGGRSSSVDPELRWSSGVLKIRETAAAGKHVVARAEIHPGDILTIEAPLAGCLLPEFYGTHCQHCYAR